MRTIYDPATEARLQHFNDYVGLYFWIGECPASVFSLTSGIVAIILTVTAVNWFQWLLGYLRRHQAGHSIHTLAPSSSRRPQYRNNIPSYISAIWRKYSVRREHTILTAHFHLGNLGQLFLISLYLLLNLLILFLGTNGDINWIAHHAAILVYANIPLVIGLCNKNNVLSLATGFAYEGLNVLHRWSARVMVIFSCIHVGGRIYVSRTGKTKPNKTGE